MIKVFDAKVIIEYPDNMTIIDSEIADYLKFEKQDYWPSYKVNSNNQDKTIIIKIKILE